MRLQKLPLVQTENCQNKRSIRPFLFPTIGFCEWVVSKHSSSQSSVIEAQHIENQPLMEGNASLWRCPLVYPTAERTRLVKVGRSPFTLTLISRVLSAIRSGITQGYVPLDTYPCVQQSPSGSCHNLIFLKPVL